MKSNQINWRKVSATWKATFCESQQKVFVPVYASAAKCCRVMSGHCWRKRGVAWYNLICLLNRQLPCIVASSVSFTAVKLGNTNRTSWRPFRKSRHTALENYAGKWQDTWQQIRIWGISLQKWGFYKSASFRLKI